MTERPRPEEGHPTDAGETDRERDESNDAGDDRAESTGNTTVADELTHTTDAGDVDMVDVGAKPDTARRAIARGEIALTKGTIEAIREDQVGKGNVLATARIGAIGAVKHTWETIPMCHHIPISNVETDFEVSENRIVLTVTVETTGKTGCEMEALEGVTTGLNTVWDMVKAVEKDEDGQYPNTGIENVRVVEKEKRSL
ncbi:cyclic pyranopterin monophosphate synthase MoaC [Halobacteriales archaeon QS_3_64_16]|nr:MAG: cyclic pyranopterin monophosphate synthase MoaC [Halobacteriales archaeon QS_3_64_16]